MSSNIRISHSLPPLNEDFSVALATIIQNEPREDPDERPLTPGGFSNLNFQYEETPDELEGFEYDNIDTAPESLIDLGFLIATQEKVDPPTSLHIIAVNDVTTINMEDSKYVTIVITYASVTVDGQVLNPGSYIFMSSGNVTLHHVQKGPATPYLLVFRTHPIEDYNNVKVVGEYLSADELRQLLQVIDHHVGEYPIASLAPSTQAAIRAVTDKLHGRYGVHASYIDIGYDRAITTPNTEAGFAFIAMEHNSYTTLSKGGDLMDSVVATPGTLIVVSKRDGRGDSDGLVISSMNLRQAESSLSILLY